ncbi:alpha/beta hydrolase [Lentzea sp. NPDC060358]|uniref:alpha/beta hydrolase n=1 Tax=Lentzea sp. NPDC060358 TaxID=3347103 RepID=UPI00366428CC
MKLLRGTTALSCALAVVLAGTGGAGASGEGAPGVARPVSSIDWQPCDGHAALDCATVPMPIDRADPAGATVPIAVARAKAAKPLQRKGVLMVNPGGPGGSGVDFAFRVAEDHEFSQALLDSFDIIGFDPRGVARSAQLRCDAGVLWETWPWDPMSEEDFGGVLAHNDRVARSCQRDNGALADHVDTTSVVRDMDALRELLGEDTISFYGRSYGTLIGQQYAESFGRNLRALVLDSNMDHSAGVADSLVPENLALERSFTEFAAWCRRTPSCVLHDRDVLALWDDLYAKATAGELGWATPKHLRSRASWSMYDPERWFGLAEFLESAAEGTGAARSARPDEELATTTQPIWCGDWQWGEADSYAALSTYRAQAEAVAPHTRLTPFYEDVLACLGWTGAVNNPQRPLHVPHAPPILMTNSLHDVATPYEWAQNVARHLPTATLLTYDGTGHGNYLLSTCARAAIDTYLLTVRTPAPGTHCPAEWPTAEPAGTTYPNTPAVR